MQRGQELARLKKELQKNPADEETFVKLWDAFLAVESWEAMAEILGMRISALEDGGEKVRALLKLANLFDEKLGDSRRAVDAYQRVLALDPRNRRALWALAALYHDLEEWQKVVEIYLLQIDLAETTEEKLALRTQLAGIYEERLRQDDQALMEYIRAVRLAPETVRILLSMEKLAGRTESFRELLAVYEDVLERIEREELRCALYLKVARLYSEKLGEPERAAEYFRQALRLSGGDPQKLLAISAFYGEEEEWAELISTYGQLIGHTDDQHLKNRLRREMARLYREGLRDPASAFYELVRVARYDPNEPGLLEDLCQTAAEANRQSELAVVLEDMGSRLDRPELQVELYSRLGQILLKDLHNAEAAAQAVEKAIQADPSNISAQRLRFDLLEASGQFEMLAQALEAFLSRPDLPEEVAHQERRRLARIAEEKLGNTEMAVALYRSSLDQQPKPAGEPPAADEDQLRQQERWEELIELLQKRADTASGPEEAQRLELEIAELQLRQGRPDLAFFGLARAWRRAPESLPLLRKLLPCAVSAELVNEALALFADRAAVLPPRVSGEAQLELAEILRQLGRSEEVLDRLRLAAELAPQSERVRRRLCEELRQRQDYSGLVEALLTFAQRIESTAEKVPLLLEAGEVCEDYLEDGGRAAEIYQRVMALDAGNSAARKGLVRLEKLLPAEEPYQDGPTIPEALRPGRAAPLPPPEMGGSPAPSTAGGQTAAVAAPPATENLSPAAVEEAEEDEESTAVTVRQPSPAVVAEAGVSPPDEITAVSPPPAPLPPAVPEESAQSQQETSGEVPVSAPRTAPALAPADSRAWLEEQVEANPLDATLWENLSQRVAEEQGDEAAFAVLVRALGRIDNQEVRTRLYRRMAYLGRNYLDQVQLGQLLETDGRIDDAESAFRAALRKNSSGIEALDGLQRLYQQRGAPDRFEAILSRALRNAQDPATRRALRMRRAQLRVRVLGHLNEALEDLDLLMADDRVNVEALLLQEEIFERLGNFEQLADAYRRHLEAVCEPAKRLDLLLALAELYERRLEDSERAAFYYRQVIELDPANCGAYEALASLLEHQRDWLGAAELLGRAASLVNEPAQAARLHLRRGRILEEQLLRPEDAEQAFRQAAEGPAPSAEALEALQEMARRRQDWVEVLRLYGLRLESEERPAARAAMLVQMGRLWSERMGDPLKASECFEEAHRLDADNLEAARQVAEMRLQAKDHRGARELLEHISQVGIEKHLSPAEVAGWRFRLAQSNEALGLDDEAESAYRQALEAAPADLDILLAFGAHLARREKWPQAVAVYEQLLQNHGHRLEPQRLSDIACLVARGWLAQAQPERALEYYQRALRATPAHLPALRACAELARQLGRHQQRADLLERLLQLSSGTQARARVALELGDVLAGPLNRPELAAQKFAEALQADPNNVELLEKQRRVLVQADQLEEAVEVLRRLAHLAPNDRQRARYLRIAADILDERMDDEVRALDLYLQALRHAPLDQRAHSAAIKILNRQRDWTRLAALQEQLIERLPPPVPGQPDRRVEILTDLVEIYRYRLDDRRRALVACEHLLSIQPGDLKVREDLARLYEADGRLDDAVALHRSLITDSPFSVDSYHALFRIYLRRHLADAALCIAAALAFLEEANADEQKLLADHRQSLVIPPGRQLGEELYQKHLLSPGARGIVGEMLSFASDYVRPLFVRDARELHLRPRDRLDARASGDGLGAIFLQGARLLDLPLPEIYCHGPQVKGVTAVNTSPPAVICSEEAVRQCSPAELRFMVGRALAFCRPENLLAVSLSPRQIRSLLSALVELAEPQRGVSHLEEETLELCRRLERHLPAVRRERLRELVERYRREQADTAVRDWIEGVEHTCNRAGFLLAGDLEAAIKVLKGARVFSPSGSSRSLIRELIFFSISEEYFAIRQALRVNI